MTLATEEVRQARKGPHYALPPVLAPQLETTEEQYSLYLRNYDKYVEFVRKLRVERHEVKKKAGTGGTQQGEESKLEPKPRTGVKAEARAAKARARKARRRAARNATKALEKDAEKVRALTKKVEATKVLELARKALKRVQNDQGSNARERRKQRRSGKQAVKASKAPEKGTKQGGKAPAKETKPPPVVPNKPRVVPVAPATAKAEYKPDPIVRSESGGIPGPADYRRHAAAVESSLRASEPLQSGYPAAASRPKRTEASERRPDVVTPFGQVVMPITSVQVPSTPCPHSRRMDESCRACLRKIGGKY